MPLHALNWVDYVIIAIITLSSLISLIRGFVREALSLASWIIAFWIALTFSASLADYLTAYISQTPLRIGIAFFILFAASLLLGALVNFLITHVIERTGLSGTDRLLGVIFGFGRGVLLVALLLLAAQMTTITTSQGWQCSQLVPTFQPLGIWLSQYLPEDISMTLNKKQLTESKGQ